MTSAFSAAYRFRDAARWPLKSTPRRLIAWIASSVAESPVQAEVPADSLVPICDEARIAARNSAAAIGLRHVFPVHTERTRLVIDLS
jgi:hypothetical protein